MSPFVHGLFPVHAKEWNIFATVMHSQVECVSKVWSTLQFDCSLSLRRRFCGDVVSAKRREESRWPCNFRFTFDTICSEGVDSEAKEWSLRDL